MDHSRWCCFFPFPGMLWNIIRFGEYYWNIFSSQVGHMFSCDQVLCFVPSVIIASSTCYRSLIVIKSITWRYSLFRVLPDLRMVLFIVKYFIWQYSISVSDQYLFLWIPLSYFLCRSLGLVAVRGDDTRTYPSSVALCYLSQKTFAICFIFMPHDFFSSYGAIISLLLQLCVVLSTQNN